MDGFILPAFRNITAQKKRAMLEGALFLYGKRWASEADLVDLRAAHANVDQTLRGMSHAHTL